MFPDFIEKTFEYGDGVEISVETGRLAKQADGSVVVRVGDTMVLATVVSRKEHLEGADFMPLSVDYRENFASAGKIPGGFLKREGKLSDHEVLTSRLVDRALRPMFPKDYHADTQVMLYLISAGENITADSMAGFAASCALSISDIPFNGPISETRVIKTKEGVLKVNPSFADLEDAQIDLLVAGSEESVTMVEGELCEVSEEDMLEAIKYAHDAIKKHCAAQKTLMEEIGREKREYNHEEHDEDLRKKVYDMFEEKVQAVVNERITNKDERHTKIYEPLEEYLENLPEDSEVDTGLVKTYFKEIEKKATRGMVLNEKTRLDGRQTDEVRAIDVKVDYLPKAHGSSLFTRGETQSLTTVTLGTKVDEQMIDSATYKGFNKFILHYNFPGFSTGEVRPNRGPGRREVGHGNLAMRALKYTLPPEEENPYTIRVVSDILESNGSSSMATVCAGCMALMDAGVKIKKPVAGIAMGLVTEPESKAYTILTDILGDEDFLGDMDFKVAGTKDGITAVQMDIKITGIDMQIMTEALEQARAGRLHILEKMTSVLDKPSEELKPHAPRSISFTIERDMIGALIGPGGKIIQEIQRETDTTITVDEVDNKGHVQIFASDAEKLEQCHKWVKSIVAQPEEGEVYVGTVKSVVPFGAFIEFMPGKEGLLHISEIRWEHIDSMDDVMEVGEEVKIKLLKVDQKTGKYKLSRKVLLPKPEKQS